MEPDRQRLAGRHLQRAGQRPGVDGAEAVRLRRADRGAHPADILQPVAGAVDRPVHDRRHAVLRPGQPGPGRALGQQEADGPSSATRFPRPGRSGRRSARRSPPSTRATSSATSATRSATGSTSGATSARWRSCKAAKLLINSADTHCTEMASLLDPLIKNGTVPPLSVFTPGLRQEVRRRERQGPDDAGAGLVRAGRFRPTLHIPAGQITAAMPLQWEQRDTGHDRPGRRRPVDHLSALQEPRGGGGLRHLGHDGLQPDRQGRPRPGYPAYAPLADTWLETQATNPYFAADPTPALKAAASQIWSGWNLVTYPDQPVWSNTVVTQLVAGKSLSSLLPRARRRARPGGAGGRVSG